MVWLITLAVEYARACPLASRLMAVMAKQFVWESARLVLGAEALVVDPLPCSSWYASGDR